MTATSERDGRPIHYDDDRLEWVFDDTGASVPWLISPEAQALNRIADALETLASCVVDHQEDSGPRMRVTRNG